MADGIAERLEGKHVLLTGVTGFVGEALLQLMLADVPGVRLTLLVRPKGSTGGEARIASLLRKPIFAGVVEAGGGVEALMAERVTALEGDLADVPPLPDDLDAVVHCAGDVSFDPPGRRGLPHQRGRHPRAAPADPVRGGQHRERALRAHLDGVRRGAPPRPRAGGSGGAPGRPRRRDHLGTRPAAVGGAPLPHRGRPGGAAQEGRAHPQPRRPADRRPGHRGGAQGVGQGRAGAARHRAGPQPGLDRLLHVHQVARRARGRGGRPHPPGLHRPAEHHRVRAGPPLPGLDRGLQDGRAADPGLRARRAAGVPGVRRHRGRHRPGRPRGRGDRGGARAPARAGDARVLPRLVR